MRYVILSLSGLFVGTFLLMVGAGVLGTVVPVRMGAADFPSYMVGIVTSGYFVGLILGGFYAHRLIAWVGHIRAYAAFASCVAAASLAHPFLIAAETWAPLRMVEGVCMAGLFICTESWLNQRTPDLGRGQVLSLYMVIVYLAQAAGQFLLPLPDPSGFALFAITAIAVSLAVIPVAATRVATPRRPRLARISLSHLFAISPIAVAGALASGLALGAFYAMAPLYIQQAGLGLAATAQFMGGAIVGGMLLQWPIGYLSDRVERRTVLAWTGIALALVSAALGLVRQGSLILYLSPLLGGAIFALYPISVAQANDRISAAERIPVSGGLITLYGVGAAFGPLLASAVMSALGALGLFVFMGWVGVGIAAYAVVRKRQAAAAPTEAKVAFQVLPRTTPVASELDPRAEPEQWPPESTDTPVPTEATPQDRAAVTDPG